jgi:hypothetical protein
MQQLPLCQEKLCNPLLLALLLLLLLAAAGTWRSGCVHASNSG